MRYMKISDINAITAVMPEKSLSLVITAEKEI